MSGLTSAATSAGQTRASIPDTVVFIFTLYHKVKDHDDSNVFKEISFGPVLPDDLFQQIDVISEGFAARSRERTGRERAVVLIRFGHRHVAFLLQGADVRGEVAVGHAERVAQLGERQFRRGGEHGHDRQPALLVNHAVEP